MMSRRDYMAAALSIALKQAKREWKNTRTGYEPVDVTIGHVAGAVRVRIDWSDEIVLRQQKQIE